MRYVHTYIHTFIHPLTHPSINLSTHPSIHLLIHPSIPIHRACQMDLVPKKCAKRFCGFLYQFFEIIRPISLDLAGMGGLIDGWMGRYIHIYHTYIHTYIHTYSPEYTNAPGQEAFNKDVCMYVCMYLFRSIHVAIDVVPGRQ